MLTAKIIIGILTGAAAALLSSFSAKVLLAKRGKKLEMKTTELTILIVLSAAFGAAILLVSSSPVKAVFYFLVLIAGETVSETDLHFRIIPNDVVLAILLLTLVFGIPCLCGLQSFPAFHVGRSLLGLAACFLLFLLPSVFSKKLGAGDVKLAAAIGFSLGIWNALTAVVIMGVLVLFVTLMQKRIPVIKFFTELIPIGPFLSFAFISVLLLTELPVYQQLSAGFPF